MWKAGRCSVQGGINCSNPQDIWGGNLKVDKSMIQKWALPEFPRKWAEMVARLGLSIEGCLEKVEMRVFGHDCEIST